MSPRAWTERLRRLGPLRRDALVAAVLGVEMQLEALFVPEDRLAVHALLLLLAGCLALRRRFPLATLALTMAPFVGVQALGQEVTDRLFVALFVCIFMSYSAAANLDGRAFWAAPPIALAGGFVAIALDDYDSSGLADVLWIALAFVTAPMVAGRLIRNRSRLQRALREKAARLERERAQEAERAVADERARIAGELHDLVAHALTEMTVQASVAARLAERRPERAEQAFAAVEGRGREALGELRRLLGVLRREDEELALAPQPSLRHVEALARRAEAAGLPVDLTVDGPPSDLPAGVDVTGYRVVQEALNRALRDHAAGHADVRVRYAADAVEVEVVDDGRAGGDAAAPLGLRERVALYGGELTAGAARDGGHLVRARLPREVAA
jgi:signal transduction histidine kinase